MNGHSEPNTARRGALQKHRMGDVERDLWVHLVHPLLKQGNIEQVAQDHIQMAFEDLQGGRKI